MYIYEVGHQVKLDKNKDMRLTVTLCFQWNRAAYSLTIQ